MESVVARALGIPRDEVTDDLGYGDIRQWDSLGHVNLMLDVEDAFRLRIEHSDAAHLVSVEAIRRYLSAPSGGRARPEPAESSSPLNPELAGVTMARTEITDVDGELSSVRYRGYSVAELADACSFEEVAHCLLYGDLPSPSQSKEFDDWLVAERALPSELREVLETFRNASAPRAVTAALSTDAAWADSETFEELVIALTARLPTIVATHAALAEGRSAPEPDPSLGHAANALSMITGRAPSEEERRAFEAMLIIQADHGLAPSTLAARVAIGVGADVRSAVAAAANVWFGALHAGAVAEAMEIQAGIISSDDAREVARRWRHGDGRPYGFGHRVHRDGDPRSQVLRDVARRLGEAVGNPQPLLQTDLLVEAVAAEWRGGLSPNFDGYAAPIYRLLGVGGASAPVLFMCARIVGWLAHISEQLANNHLIRPRLDYAGSPPRSIDRGAAR